MQNPGWAEGTAISAMVLSEENGAIEEKLKDDNIYFIGDGAGKAGNIVTAAATGLVAADDILNKIKSNKK